MKAFSSKYLLKRNALKTAYSFFWLLLGFAFLFIFILPNANYFEFGLLGLHRSSYLPELLPLNVVNYPLISFLYVFIIEVFISICTRFSNLYISSKWIQITSLTLLRVFCYLPQQHLSLLFLFVWGAFIGREITNSRQVKSLFVANVLAAFFLSPFTNNRNLFESIASYQGVYLFSLFTIFWAIYGFSPQKTTPLQAKTQVATKDTRTDSIKTKLKKLKVFAVPFLLIALANICFQIINTIWMFFSGSLITPINFLFGLLTLYPSTPFGIFNAVCCIASALWCYYCYSYHPQLAASSAPAEVFKQIGYSIAGFVSYIFMIEISYKLLLHEGKFLTILLPDEYWAPKHTGETSLLADSEFFSPATLFSAFGGIEELLYTGVLSTLLFKKTRLHPFLSIFLLVFSRIAIHLYQGALPLFTVGIWSLFAAVYYYRTQRLAPLVLAHTFTNYYNFYDFEGDIFTSYLLDSYVFPTLLLLGSLTLILFARPRKL